MRFFIFVLYLFVAILCRTLFCDEVSDSKATRNVKYELTEDSMYVDSVTMTMRITKADAQ